MAPKRTATPAETVRPMLIELPANERGLAPDQVERFDKAKAELLNPRLVLSERAKDDRARVMATVEHGPRRAAAQLEIDAGIGETVALAEARGEEVRQTQAGPRIVSRGGLTQAYEDGHLKQAHGPQTSTDLYEAGKRYRDAYEIAEGLTSSSGGGGGYGPKAPQVRIIEAGAMLLAMRAAITDRQRHVLDRVCGKDMRLRAAATDLKRGFPSTRNALRGGLETLARLKIDRPAKLLDRIERAAAAIATVRR